MRAPPEETRLRANGLEHHVLVWDGGGETVVLCHGFLDLGWSWMRVARQLADEGYRAVAFDWRGHGESEWVGRGGYYHFPDYLMDLDQLLPQLGESPVHLVGHSMGGTVCSMYGGLRPERIRTLTLLEGMGPPSFDFEFAADKTKAWLESVQKSRLREGPRVMRDLAQVLRRMRVQNPALDDELGALLAEKSTRPGPEGEGRVFGFDPLHQTTSPMPFRAEVLASFTSKITAPALIVVGETGLRLPDERERAAPIAEHRFVELEGVGHMIHWFAPDALTDALLLHFRRPAPPR